jgi:hypothetical protein
MRALKNNVDSIEVSLLEEACVRITQGACALVGFLQGRRFK